MKKPPPWIVHHGDCLDVMRSMPAASVDAVVCDPPYALTAGKKGGTGAASINLESPYGRARIGTGNGGGHPTVKPVDLMRWLVRLVAPIGGLVLDPFLGSGTTGVAALEEGCRFVGIEREAEYVAIARARIEAAARAPMLDFGSVTRE